MIPEQQEEVIIGQRLPNVVDGAYPPSSTPHGDMDLDQSIEINATTSTEHSAKSAGNNFIITLDGFDEEHPDASFELVVTGSSIVVTSPADAAFFLPQTLSAIGPGTFKIELFRLTEDATKNYGIAVGVKQ